MSPIRVAGSVLGLITGVLMVYVRQTVTPLPPLGPPCASICSPGTATFFPTFWFAVLGGLLAVSSLASLSGVRLTFVMGAVLSGSLVILMLVNWGGYPFGDQVGVVVLGVLTVVLDAVAAGPARALSEKDSPLNLPVFG